MQTPLTSRGANDLPEQVLEAVSGLVDCGDTVNPSESSKLVQGHPASLFKGSYAGCMEMAADVQTVSLYLDEHRNWFLRCAHPMKAEPLGENGYDLTVGHFGALGYDVEPKIGLNLLPQNQGIYRIETIPIPNYTPPGYDVDFRAALELKELGNSEEVSLTQVDWQLDLKVWVSFPRFINALPKRMIQKTGDRLLSTIVRQVSRCLTHKVQEDFHRSLNLPFPDSYNKRNHHFLDRFSRPSNT
jgi:hypothetical protein